ncbi:MAG: UAA transporter [Thelocarpon superellum]|nr:MAG: UAA transporter [Thelocarpon superellum]
MVLPLHPPFSESSTPTPINNARSPLNLVNPLDLSPVHIENDAPITHEHDGCIADPTAANMTRYCHLALYFVLNLALTLYNKAVLQEFRLPYLLTSLHAASGCVGCFVLHQRGVFVLRRLSTSEVFTMLAFSLLYTLNIAISNVSLNLVTIPFHQVVRGTSPIFTAVTYGLVYGKVYSMATYLCLVPVMLGVGFATYGDYYYTAAGFALTLTGTALASVKTIATNRLQTGPLRLSALDLLYRMSPLALGQSLIYAYLSGEFCAFHRLAFDEGHLTRTMFYVLVLNGVIAFALNIVSFTANKKTGALTMAVAANIKQVLTIWLSIVVFHLHLGMLDSFDLDYVCPFSKKLFNTVYHDVFPLVEKKYSGKVQFIFRQQIQPWHPSSTLTHEAGVAVLKISPDQFYPFSAALFEKQTEFFDVNTVQETRNKTYERLAKLAATVGLNEKEVFDLLHVDVKPAQDGSLNIGNGVTNDVKLLVKVSILDAIRPKSTVRIRAGPDGEQANRLTGVHVTPTVLFNGIVENSISSGWTKDQWDEWLTKNIV